MKVFKYLIIIVLFIAVAIIGFLFYAGFFAKAEVAEKQLETMYLVGLNHKGDYSKAGEISNRVFEYLKEKNVESTLGFGIYYDNPRDVKTEELRSFIGCVIAAEDSAKVSFENMRAELYPAKKHVIINFPLKNELTYSIGPIKVYPQLNKYIQEKNYKTGAAIEIYDVPNKKIIYAMPIHTQ